MSGASNISMPMKKDSGRKSWEARFITFRANCRD